MTSFTHIEIIGYSAGLISFLNMFRYMYAIQKTGTKPSLAYWIIAEMAMILIALSSYAIGDRTTLWIAVAYASTQLVIIALAITKGNYTLRKLDISLIALSLLSVLIWWYTDNPLYALVINVGIDASGYIPLFRDIWRDPSREDRIYWGIAGCACVLNMFAVRDLSFSSVLYPWYLGVVNMIVFVVLIAHTAKPLIRLRNIFSN